MIWIYSILRGSIQSISDEEIASMLAEKYPEYIYFRADLMTSDN